MLRRIYIFERLQAASALPADATLANARRVLRAALGETHGANAELVSKPGCARPALVVPFLDRVAAQLFDLRFDALVSAAGLRANLIQEDTHPREPGTA